MKHRHTIECPNCDHRFTIESEDPWAVLPVCPKCSEYVVCAR